MVPAKLHGKRLSNSNVIQLTSKWIPFQSTCNFQATSNYGKLPVSLTKLIKNFKSWLMRLVIRTLIEYFKVMPFGQGIAVIPADGACKITWTNCWGLTSQLTSKWITFKNTESNFTLISLITFEVLNQTLSNLQGTCRNTQSILHAKLHGKRLRIDVWIDV